MVLSCSHVVLHQAHVSHDKAKKSDDKIQEKDDNHDYQHPGIRIIAWIASVQESSSPRLNSTGVEYYLSIEIKKTKLLFLEYLWTLQFFSEISWPLKRVYWVDTYLDYIEAVDYDGGNRKTILRGSPVQNLYSASVFENSLYLTSWRNNSILRVNKFHPVKVRIFWEGHKKMTKSPSFYSTTNVLSNLLIGQVF